jgi:hypothetical protein
MSNKKPLNEGYRPQKVEKGYQPAQQPNKGLAQDGYQPTTSQKPATSQPPANPPPKKP